MVTRRAMTAALGWLLFVFTLLAPFSTVQAAENPAWWKYRVKGEFATVLANLKSGLEASQFIVTGEENLSQGLENNKSIWGETKWNTIGFQHATALHFCSLVFNQEVFNVNMDWSILCPFKVVAYSMKNNPDVVTIITVRPTYLLARDPHKRAKELARKIENRIVSAIQAGVSP